jgi:hypothetical protein
VVRAGGDDQLTVGPDDLAHAVRNRLDADGAVALEDDPLDEHAGGDLEVRPPLGRVQERVGGAAAQPVALSQLEARDAFGLGHVQVGDVLVAGLYRRLELEIGERGHRAAVGHGERAADPVELVLPPLVVLGALEVRQHLVVRPAGATARRPLVEVRAVAAEVDHRVDRAGAADHTAAGQVEPAAAEAGLGLAEEVPVEARLEGDREHRGNVDRIRRVGTAGLEQVHRHIRVLAQAGCEHAAGRPGSDDHVVSGHRSSPPGSRSREQRNCPAIPLPRLLAMRERAG